jgi:hypothetical protein
VVEGNAERTRLAVSLGAGLVVPARNTASRVCSGFYPSGKTQRFIVHWEQTAAEEDVPLLIACPPWVSSESPVPFRAIDVLSRSIGSGQEDVSNGVT